MIGVFVINVAPQPSLLRLHGAVKALIPIPPGPVAVRWIRFAVLGELPAVIAIGFAVARVFRPAPFHIPLYWPPMAVVRPVAKHRGRSCTHIRFMPALMPGPAYRLILWMVIQPGIIVMEEIKIMQVRIIDIIELLRRPISPGIAVLRSPVPVVSHK